MMHRLHVARLTAIALAACIIVAGGCTERDAASVAADTEKPQDVVETAKQVVAAMKAKDGAGLAEFVHRERGVRFSPCAFVDVGSDRVLSRADVRRLWEDHSVYSWGHAEGTGDPIMLTPAGYFERFVMDRDFTAAASVTVNDYQTRGTTHSNAAAVYTNGTSVEFFLEPSEGHGDPAFDWRALRLVLENQDGSWQLIAVIHDEWTA